ncbi:uroporphyrinogen-III synthase [Ichthyobacterium seriolicida]|uniref:Uroporphyrinogen-III synthase n=1 Tax=Ichthyobacterium seriolicida TaxID=242600 RepID=A0A1J1E873_9FLAO|nr:uroporphyrinogen-III synthase [Ichthyobacterium seriolicida]BAV94131.1 uroporphyrinogen -III synthase, divergent, Flavobacterial type [Ichthyobacterium seriolicida]
MLVLSTKKIPAQYKRIFKSGIEFKEYSFISIKYTPPVLEEVKNSNIIFTSKNSVRSIESQICKWRKNSFYCVGEQTFDYLQVLGISEAFSFFNVSDLADFLVQKKIDDILFFRGDISLDVLSTRIGNSSVKYREIVVYKTVLNPIEVDEKRVSIIMFFSPSAVRSFFYKNRLCSKTKCLCIGLTTAMELRKYSDNCFYTPKTPSVKGVIELLKAEIKNDKK